MKSLSVLLISGFILVSGCGIRAMPTNNNNNNSSSTSQYKANTEFEKNAAVNLTATINIFDTVTGADTPKDEASDSVSKIDTALVSLFDENSKFLNSFTLQKTDPATKGEIGRFKGGFRALPTGKITFKFAFNNKQGDILFESQGTTELKAKSVYQANIDLQQTSVKRDPTAPTKTTVNIDETKEDSYAKGQMIIGLGSLEMKQDDFKANLEKEGIKVTTLNKGLLNNYTVSFSEPSMAEALIIATKINKFDYIELNGLVKPISF